MAGAAPHPDTVYYDAGWISYSGNVVY